MNSHVGVASHNGSRYVASDDTFVNAPHCMHHNHGYYGQEPMSTLNSLSFSTTSNIQHVNPYSSAISSQYVVPPQDMPMNERIGYDNANYLANYSQNSAPYANINAHNSASYVTSNSSQIKENSARCTNGNIHDSASYVAPSSSRINERWVNIHTHDAASYVVSNPSRIINNSARHSQSDIDFKKAMLEFELSLEKQNKDFKNKYFGSTSKRSITSKSSAMSMKKKFYPLVE
jgi:hypothetical protein